ncbi:MAG: HNH endonuclease [Deltaproteobacteria bacterium]|nr:MAG: HNH endonuclease [Deltaproteobacteria bacterium]
MINSNVLVLNRSFLPIHITTLRRAFSLLYLGLARAVDQQYQTFDFKSWSELSVETGGESIGLVNRAIRVPRVILLTGFDRIPKRHVRFSRMNIYARDNNTCQYCGKTISRNQVNLDHVIPRSRGGTSTWENVVCCCFNCNRKKGGRTPEEAGMKLLSIPRRPKWTPYVNFSFSRLTYQEWKPFLYIVDASYWNVELEE